MLTTIYPFFFLISAASASEQDIIHAAAELAAAVKSGSEGQVFRVAPGTYKLEAPLELKSRMEIHGSGMDSTIITHVDTWKPLTTTLPDPEMTTKGMDTYAYLIRLQERAESVSISNLTLQGPQMHGAIFGVSNKNLHVNGVRIKDTLWAGIRTFSMQHAKIDDCEFIDAGGRWKRGGKAGLDGGITGGAIFAIWMADTEIFNNRFIRTQQGKADEFYGIKGRQAKRCRVHHNTIHTNFSIEFPFENDEDVEIDHNVCYGTISIPKYAGGPVPASGKTFHIHHNWLRPSYAIEFVRNGVEIDHNLFDFDVTQDGGNLISAFGEAPAAGPASFHNNLVSNPGRGVMWMNEPYNNLDIRNNHIICRTTATPRKDGLFGFNGDCDFTSIKIRNNIIECQGLSRPLLRSEESYHAIVENNTLINIADASRLRNPPTNSPVGLVEPLHFRCGAHGEFVVNGWDVKRASEAATP